MPSRCLALYWGLKQKRLLDQVHPVHGSDVMLIAESRLRPAFEVPLSILCLDSLFYRLAFRSLKLRGWEKLILYISSLIAIASSTRSPLRQASGKA
jgi:hypothetical protein